VSLHDPTTVQPGPLQQLPMLLVVVVISASAAGESGFSFSDRGGDVSVIDEVDLDALPIGAWGTEDLWPPVYEWNQLSDPSNLAGILNHVGSRLTWSLRSDGGTRMLADLLEAALARQPTYPHEARYIRATIGRLGSGESTERDAAQKDLCDYILIARVRVGERCTEFLRQVSDSDDAEVRERATAILDEVSERAGSMPTTFLESPDRSDNCLAAGHLLLARYTMDRRLIPLLALFLTHPYEEIRWAALLMLECMTYRIWDRTWVANQWEPDGDERRRAWIKWWNEHKNESELDWLRSAFSSLSYGEDLALAFCGDMKALRRLLSLEDRLAERERDQWEMWIDYLNVWEYGDVLRMPPKEIRKVFRDAIEALPEDCTWLDWIQHEMETRKKIFHFQELKCATNQSLGVAHHYWVISGPFHGWSARNERDAKVPDPNPSPEEVEAAIVALRKWRAGPGKRFDRLALDRERIEEQGRYEKYLREKHPVLFEWLEYPEIDTWDIPTAGAGYRFLQDLAAFERTILRGWLPEKPFGRYVRLFERIDERVMDRFLEARFHDLTVFGRLDTVDGQPDIGRWSDEVRRREGERYIKEFGPRVYMRILVPQDQATAGAHFVCVIWPQKKPERGPAMAGLITDTGRMCLHRKGIFVGLDSIPDVGDVFVKGKEWSEVGSDLWEDSAWPDCPPPR